MKKSLTLFTTLLLFLCSFLNVNAQSFDVEWGQEREFDKRKHYITGVIGNEANGYYVLRANNNDKKPYAVIRYNMQHEVEREFEVSCVVKGKEATWEGLYMLKDNFVVFLSYADGKADKNTLYACTITKDGEQSAPQEVDVISIKKRRNAGTFYTYLSEDETKFLIVHKEIYEKKETEKYNYKMLTSRLEPVWEKAVDLPYKDEDFSLHNYRIDEDGNVFLLGTLRMDKKKIQYKLFAFFHKKDKMEEVNINFAKAYAISDLRFDYLDGHLVFLGFFINEKKYGLQGIIYTKVNAKTLETVMEKVTPFNKKDLLKLTTERAAKKGKGASYSYSIDDIIVQKNGDMKIVAESFEIHEVTTRTQYGTTTTYYYYYANIMVVDMDKEGNIKWVASVPKLQVSKNDGGIYSSYILTYDDENLYMVFNDNPKNTAPNTKPEKRGKIAANTLKIKKLSVTLAKVDNKGDVTTEMFFKSKNDGKTALRPKLYSRFSPDRVLIYAVKGKAYKFGFLSIKK